MMVEDRAAQLIVHDMGINLRRRNIDVAEQLLEAAQVRPALQQVRSEGMAHDMRGYPAAVQACANRQPVQQLADAPPRQMAFLAGGREQPARLPAPG